MSNTSYQNSEDTAAGVSARRDADPRPAGALPEPTISEPIQKNWGLLRAIVLSGVAMATIALLLAGYFWGYYRWQHIVIRNASVKGRVYKVGARIDSQIRSVEVQPGQRVVKDQLLIRLVDDHLQAAARQAEAELQAAVKREAVERLAIEQERRRLTLEVERTENVCKALTSDIKAAQSDYNRWQFERVRIASLLASGIGAVSELDNVTTQRDSAAARVEVAQGNLAAAESNCRLARVQVEGLKVREAGLEVLLAEVELARQRLALCEADLAATLIRSPAEGWVVERLIEPGGSAKVGEPMMSLWLGTPWIEAWVDEKRLGRVRIGSPVDVSLPAFPGRKLRGLVESIGVLADKELHADPVPSTLHSFFPENAMVPVRIAVAEGQVRLQPGLSAIVGISDALPGTIVTRSVTPDSFLASSALVGNEANDVSRPKLKTANGPN